MRKLIVVGLVLFNTVSSYSQFDSENISFELRYPVPIGDNFINKGFDNGYIGLFDIGLDYNVIKKDKLGIGILLNSSVLRLTINDLTLLVLSPKVKVEYEIDINKLIIIPQIGIGYSNWRFRAPGITYLDEFGNQIQDEQYKQNLNGLTLKGATKLVINNDKNLKWHFNLSYEFTKLEKPENLTDNNNYNQNIQLIYPGIGMIWNFGR
jgi:hypothetical protein